MNIEHLDLLDIGLRRPRVTYSMNEEVSNDKNSIPYNFVNQIIDCQKDMLKTVDDWNIEIYNTRSCSNGSCLFGMIKIVGQPQDDLDPNKYIRVMERRMISNNICSYYFFILVQAKPVNSDPGGRKIIQIGDPTSEKRNDYTDIVYDIDGISRVMDYCLDIGYHSASNTICLTNDIHNTVDPIWILTKGLLLYHQLFKGNNFELGISQENDNEWKYICDQFLTNNMRTDWMLNRDFMSSDKISVFLSQLNLKEEIFIFFYNHNRDDDEEFIKEYTRLFGDCEIYKLSVDEYPRICKFLAFGGGPFSTKEINEVWKRYI